MNRVKLKNNHYYSIFVVSTFVLLTILLPNNASAVASVTGDEPVVIKDIDENKTANCEIVKSKRLEKIQNLKDNKLKHLNLYHNMESKLNNHVNLFKDKGYDTDKLQKDTEKFSLMIKDYESKYDDLIKTLSQIESYECDNANKTKLVRIFKSSRADLSVAQKKRTEIGKFYREVIKVDIKEILQNKVRESTSSAK